MRNVLLATANGYVWDNESQKLATYQLMWAEFNPNAKDKVKIKYHAMVGGEEKDLEVDYVNNLKVYANESDFKRGEIIPFEHLYMSDKILPFVDISDGNGHCTWVFEDGKAKRKNISHITMRFDGELKTTTPCYKQEADVYKHNDIEVKEIDGSIRVVECLAKKMQFTDEQKGMINQMKNLAKQMQDSGLKLFWDYNNESVVAVNVRRVTWEGIKYYECATDNMIACDEFATNVCELNGSAGDCDCVYISE